MDDKNERDSLSEMLSQNKKRRREQEKLSDDNIDPKSRLDALSKEIEEYSPPDIDMGEDDDEAILFGYSEQDEREASDNSDENELRDTQLPPEPPTPEEKRREKRVREARRQLKKRNRTILTVIRIALGAIISAAVIFVGVNVGQGLLNALLDYAGIGSSEFEVQVEIPDDATLDQVAEILEENGIITDVNFFKIYVEHKDDPVEFVAGEFTLSSTMNYSGIVSELTSTKTVRETVLVTIIEGMTAREIGELLEENAVCKADDFEQFYREKMNLYDFERRVLVNSHKFYQLEGYLFPDRYEFYVCNELREDPNTDYDTTDEAEVAAKKIYSGFNSQMSKSMYKKMNEMGLTLDELITLASIVQSETGDPDDMKLVASVFLNRLRDSENFPCLESDVTVFYVRDFITPYYNSEDFSVSLQTISDSYDTYVCEGIPAGAVCNPGMDAINAVLANVESDYYYFCANEETGETFFASTREEHEQNLIKAGIVEE